MAKTTIDFINISESEISSTENRIFKVREAVMRDSHNGDFEKHRDHYGTLLVNLQQMIQQALLLESRLLEDFPRHGGPITHDPPNHT